MNSQKLKSHGSHRQVVGNPPSANEQTSPSKKTDPGVEDCLTSLAGSTNPVLQAAPATTFDPHIVEKQRHRHREEPQGGNLAKRWSIALLLCWGFFLGLGDPATAIEVTRGPVLQSLTETSVVLTWRTNTRSDAVVEFGKTATLERIACDATRRKHHSVTLHHLDPSSEYNYRIRGNGKILAPTSTFRTANPETETTFSFGVIGDPGRGNQIQYDEAALLDALKTRFVLMPGDIVTPHGEWENYDPQIFTPYSSLMPKIPFWPALGNHDYETDNGAPFLDAFTLPTNNPAETERYYSFDYGNAHFIVLDGDSPHYPGSPQYRWVVNELTHHRREWNFVICHYPPYSSSIYGPEVTGFAVRRNLGPVFEAFGVDVYFSGHKHHYERFYPIFNEQIDEERGVRYVVTGGGGASLSQVFGSDLTAYFESVHHIVHLTVDDDIVDVQMIRADGTLGDSFTASSREWTRPVGQINREECVLHLRFDEGAGNWATDSSSAGHDGYLGASTGSDAADPSWVEDGFSGGCLAFNPQQTPQFVTVPDDQGIFDFEDEFTLMAWVKTDETYPWNTVVSGGQYRYALYSIDDGRARGYLSGFTPPRVGPSNGGAPPGKWVHVAMTYKQGTARLYYNGEYQTATTMNGTPDFAVDNLFVGFDGHPKDGFRGLIDEVKVFRKSLNRNRLRVEIFSDFAELDYPTPPAAGAPPSPGQSDDLICQLSFDENSGQAIADSSGYGNDGTRGDDATAESTDPNWAPTSKYGSGALEFDGLDDRVTVPDLSGDFDLSEEFTLMAWIHFSDRGPWRTIISGGNYRYSLYLHNGALRSYLLGSAPGASKPAGLQNLTFNQWHHVAFVKQGKSISLYVDGKREMINTLTKDSVSPVSLLRVGFDGHARDCFKGYIDEVKIYRRGLSQPEINREMNETFGTPYTPGVELSATVLDLSFEEGADQTVANSDSARAGAGYLGTSPTADSQDPSWVVSGGPDGSNALRFDGADQTVTIPDLDGSLDLDQTMTLMAWVRYESSEGWQAILSGGNYRYTLYLHSGGALRAYFSSLSPKASPAGVARIAPQTWTHVAFTKDRSTVRVYIDGVEISSSEHLGSIPPVNRFLVGFDGYPGDGFDGEIDRVKVFNRVLSAEEITTARNE